MIKKTITILSAIALLASCTSNDDLGNVSGDYLKVADVVLSGNHSSATLSVEADCTWRITESTSWLTVNPLQGTGNATVELTTGANPSSLEERSCEITFTSDGGVQRVITLSQGKNNESMSVSTTEMTFGESGGEQSFTVTSNTQWEISGGADWLTFSPGKGTDNGTVTVTVQANEQETSREAFLTIIGNSGTTFTISVRQQGKNITMLIEPSEITATDKGATYTFQVQSNTDWTVTSNIIADWVAIADGDKSGSGNKTVHVTLKDNTSGGQRPVTISVTNASGSVTRTCVITQAGATLPAVTQPAVSDIGRYQATVSSSFSSSLDATAAGFCYATTPNPTVNDTSVPIGIDPQLPNGSVLTTTLTGLSSGTRYYVRAWVRNAYGIGYSPETTEYFQTEGTTPGDGENPTPNL